MNGLIEMFRIAKPLRMGERPSWRRWAGDLLLITSILTVMLGYSAYERLNLSGWSGVLKSYAYICIFMYGVLLSIRPLTALRDFISVKFNARAHLPVWALHYVAHMLMLIFWSVLAAVANTYFNNGKGFFVHPELNTVHPIWLGLLIVAVLSLPMILFASRSKDRAR